MQETLTKKLEILLKFDLLLYLINMSLKHLFFHILLSVSVICIPMILFSNNGFFETFNFQNRRFNFVL